MSAPARPRRTWDLVLSIVLLVGYLLITGIACASAIFLAFAGDSCGSSTVCDYNQMAVGSGIVFLGVWVPTIFVLAATIVLLVLRRIAFWVPVVGIVLTTAILVAGWAVVTSAVQPLA